MKNGKSSAADATYELPLSHDLLDYYRQRIQHSEQEYQDALDAIDNIKVSHSDFHQLSWDLHAKMNQVETLQRELGHAHTLVFEERKQLLKALADNDELRLEELKDRKKIRYLLSLGASSAAAKYVNLEDENETTYFKERLERRFIRSGKSAPVQAQQSAFAEATNEDSEDAETLRLRVKSLRAQLDEQARMYEDSIATIKAEHESRAHEEIERQQQDDKRIEELLEKIGKLQTFCRENTREMLEVKRAYKVLERRDKEEKAKLLHDISQARIKLGDEKGRNDSMEKKVEIRVVRRNESLVHELRQQVARYEKEIRDQRSKVTDTVKQSENQLEGFKQKIGIVNNNYRTLKQRRDFEVEGFTNEIKALKKQIEVRDKQLEKLKPVEDAELELLKTARKTGEKASQISSDLQSMKARLYKTEREVQSLAF